MKVQDIDYIPIEKLISRLETDLKLAKKYEADYGKPRLQYQKKNLKKLSLLHWLKICKGFLDSEAKEIDDIFSDLPTASVVNLQNNTIKTIDLEKFDKEYLESMIGEHDGDVPEIHDKELDEQEQERGLR